MKRSIATLFAASLMLAACTSTPTYVETLTPTPISGTTGDETKTYGDVTVWMDQKGNIVELSAKATQRIRDADDVREVDTAVRRAQTDAKVALLRFLRESVTVNTNTKTVRMNDSTSIKSTETVTESARGLLSGMTVVSDVDGNEARARAIVKAERPEAVRKFRMQMCSAAGTACK